MCRIPLSVADLLFAATTATGETLATKPGSVWCQRPFELEEYERIAKKDSEAARLYIRETHGCREVVGGLRAVEIERQWSPWGWVKARIFYPESKYLRPGAKFGYPAHSEELYSSRGNLEPSP